MQTWGTLGSLQYSDEVRHRTDNLFRGVMNLTMSKEGGFSHSRDSHRPPSNALQLKIDHPDQLHGILMVEEGMTILLILSGSS